MFPGHRYKLTYAIEALQGGDRRLLRSHTELEKAQNHHESDSTKRQVDVEYPSPSN